MAQNKVVTRSAFVRNHTAENRTAEFVISTEAVDTYRTVFKIDGWDLSRYNQNPVVLYQHRAASNDPDDVIGTSEVFIEDGQLIGRVTFEDAETNPKAEKVFRKVQNGTLKMASINALSSEYRMGNEAKGEDPKILYFTRQELMEWSIVTVGSNPDAHKRNAEVSDEIRNQLAVNQIEVNDDIQINQQPKRTVHEAQVLINKNKVL